MDLDEGLTYCGMEYQIYLFFFLLRYKSTLNTLKKYFVIARTKAESNR